jgi:BolA protein
MSNYDPALRKASSLDIQLIALPVKATLAGTCKIRANLIDRYYSIFRGTSAALTVAAMAAMPLIMTMKDNITKKLTEAFAPESVDVIDESHLHAGHAGHRPDGETHFRIYIVSQAFAGKSRLERHRLINALLASELAASVHALAISAQAPGEATTS